MTPIDPAEHTGLVGFAMNKHFRGLLRHSRIEAEDVHQSLMIFLIAAVCPNYDSEYQMPSGGTVEFSTYAMACLARTGYRYIRVYAIGVRPKNADLNLSMWSLNHPVFEGNRIDAYWKYLPDEREGSHRGYAPRAMASLVDLVHREFGSRDADVFSRRLRGQTLSVIGGDLGLTRERVRQIEFRVHQWLRERRALGMFCDELEDWIESAYTGDAA